MSTRWYPLYKAGNPQLRVFLPNFWMKLVSSNNQPENVVEFHCSIEMTKHDIKNYLEKIYNVYSADVRTVIKLGEFKACKYQKCVIKDDDVKVAYISLKKGEKFVFPDIFSTPKKDIEDDMEKQKETVKQEYSQFLEPNSKTGLPPWFKMF